MKPDWKKKHSSYMIEKDVRNQCVDYLDKVLRIGTYKYFIRVDKRENIHDIGYCPDLIVWLQGQNLFTIENGIHSEVPNKIITLTFEFKSPKGTGRETDLQKDFHEFIDGSQHDHYILNDVDEFIEIIQANLR